MNTENKIKFLEIAQQIASINNTLMNLALDGVELNDDQQVLIIQAAEKLIESQNNISRALKQ